MSNDPGRIERLFNNPFVAAIAAGFILVAFWVFALTRADHLVGLLARFAGVSVAIVALHLVLVWFVWRIRTIFWQRGGIPAEMSAASRAVMGLGAHLSVALCILAAAIICAS